MTVVNLYLFISCLLINPVDKDIDTLFNNWNKATLQSLRNSSDLAKKDYEKGLYENRLNALPAGWQIVEDSMNRESIRWKFLRKISLAFNWKDKSWTVIEVIKSGERIRLMNYLIYYSNSRAQIIAYDYVGGEWVKLNERQMGLKMKDLTLKTTKGLYESGDYSHDLILTNFKSSSILLSTYVLETSLSKSSKIVSIVN